MNYGPSPNTRYPIPEQTRLVYLKTIIQNPNIIVGGNPAQEIRKLFEDSIVEELLNIRWWDWEIEKITRHLTAICGGDIEALRQALDSE